MRIILTFTLLLALLPLNAAQIDRGPYTEDVQQTTAVINFKTDSPVPAWIEYGPKGKCSQLMAISPQRINHSLTIHGLIPNTEFCYKVYVPNNAGNGVQAPKEGSFTTLYTPERKIVNFLVIGNTAEDAQTGAEIKNQMSKSMEDYDADFIVHTGDISQGGLTQTATNDFFKPYSKILAKNPLIAALGEDEYGTDRNSNEGKGFLASNFKKIHNMPWSKGTPNYYYIDTANARILVIDTNRPYGALQAPKIDKGSPQYEWLRTSLATVETGKWKIVVMHHPVYSSGKTEDLLSQTLAPLFEAQKVNLVIQGHQGAYERTNPIVAQAPSTRGGPIYITVGGSGKFFEPASYSNEWSNKYLETPHFAHISIVDRKLSIRAYTHDNKRIDALDIYY